MLRHRRVCGSNFFDLGVRDAPAGKFSGERLGPWQTSNRSHMSLSVSLAAREPRWGSNCTRLISDLHAAHGAASRAALLLAADMAGRRGRVEEARNVAS